MKVPQPRGVRVPPLQTIITTSPPVIHSLAPPREFFTATDKRHPLYAQSIRVLQLYATRPLRWTVSSPLSISRSSTVRNFAKRRLWNAFKAALEARGWDQFGQGPGGVKGAVKLVADRRVVEADFDEVRQRAEGALEKLIKRLGGHGVNPGRGGGEKPPRRNAAGSTIADKKHGWTSRKPRQT